jgi:hypothetical protein
MAVYLCFEQIRATVHPDACIGYSESTSVSDPKTKRIRPLPPEKNVQQRDLWFDSKIVVEETRTRHIPNAAYRRANGGHTKCTQNVAVS